MKKRGKIKDAERQLLSLEKEDVVKVKEVNEKKNVERFKKKVNILATQHDPYPSLLLIIKSQRNR